ncbi:MAG: DNA replication and repair protein RecF, partial [Clostridia bacterium]|nr:DNA replication and repair protein RecF [Clostridia bacterium]
MTVTTAIYENWRNIASARVEFSPGINVLWGMNAQGKSNILEGIYFFARGRSFRGAREKELVRFGSEFARASLSFRRDGYENDTALEAVLPLAGRKRLTRNGAPLSSAAEMLGNFRAVLFTPSNLSVVSGGPGERRAFLDIALSQISGDYLLWLRRWTKLLAERNALIRRAGEGESVSAEEWAVYAEGLAECGAWIACYRADYVSLLAGAVGRYFAGMTGGSERPALLYRSHALPEDAEPLSLLTDPGAAKRKRPDPALLYDKLTLSREREIAAGATLWGIHKDDVILTLNGREARAYASQGQQRSFVLSMKLGEAEIARAVGGEYPAVLLDDVFSELDENRRRYILDALAAEDGENGSSRQIIITSCEPDVIPGARASRVCFHRV